jgi:hypothetical protein
MLARREGSGRVQPSSMQPRNLATSVTDDHPEGGSSGIRTHPGRWWGTVVVAIQATGPRSFSLLPGEDDRLPLSRADGDEERVPKLIWCSRSPPEARDATSTPACRGPSQRIMNSPPVSLFPFGPRNSVGSPGCSNALPLKTPRAPRRARRP